MIPLFPISSVVGAVAGVAHGIFSGRPKAPSPPSAAFAEELGRLLAANHSAGVRFTQAQLQGMTLEQQSGFFASHLGQTIEVQDTHGLAYRGTLGGTTPAAGGLALQINGQQIPVSQIQTLQFQNEVSHPNF